MKLQDQLFATIIEKAILLNRGNIEQRLNAQSTTDNHTFFSEMTSEVVEIFDQNKKILTFIFAQLEHLPKTKRVLTQDNSIIELLKKDISRRLQYDIDPQKLNVTIEQYINILVGNILQQKKSKTVVKKNLLQLLESNLSSKDHLI